MNDTNKAPTAEKILSLLACLIADQYGVKITYEFEKGCEEA